MRLERIPKLTAILGILFVIISYLLPMEWLKSVLFFMSSDLVESMLMSIMIVVLPLLGIIGSLFSLIKKQWLLLVIHLLLIFSAQIAYYLAQFIYSF